MAFKYMKIPGYVKLQNHMHRFVLEETQRLAWLLTSDEKKMTPEQRKLRADYKAMLPAVDLDARLEALHELGIVAQNARGAV